MDLAKGRLMKLRPSEIGVRFSKTENFPFEGREKKRLKEERQSQRKMLKERDFDFDGVWGKGIEDRLMKEKMNVNF